MTKTDEGNFPSNQVEAIPSEEAVAIARRLSQQAPANSAARLAWIPLWRRQVRAEIEQGILRMMDERGYAPIHPQHRSEEMLTETGQDSVQ